MPTPFEERVYAAVRLVPPGRVTTYGALARQVGCGSAQAVGQALRRNPYAPGVPCHRVIRSDLGIGGFFGKSSGPEVRRKVRLLREEGVRFAGGRLCEPWRVFRFGGSSSGSRVVVEQVTDARLDSVRHGSRISL